MAGARTRYDPVTMPGLALELYPQGMTDAEFAAAAGISVRTLYNWQARYPEFRAAVQQGKRPANRIVEAALLAAALGGEYAEREYRYVDGRPELVRETVRQREPNVTALIFWLKNREPERWADVQRHAGGDGGPVQLAIPALEDLIARGPAELARLYREALSESAPSQS